MANNSQTFDELNDKVKTMSKSFLGTILKYKFARYVVGVIVSFFTFGLLFLAGSAIVKSIYYKVMPGSWFVDYYSVVVDDAQVGDDVHVTLCRTLRYDKPKVLATRTFFYEEKAGDFKPVGQYNFQPELEKTDNPCVTLPIPPDKQPQKVGKFKFYTELEFYVGGDQNCQSGDSGCDKGERKVARYTSNEYRLEESEASLRDAIKDLQRRIKILQERQKKLFENRTNAHNKASTLPPAISPSEQQNGNSMSATPAKPNDNQSNGNNGQGNNQSEPNTYRQCVADKNGLLGTVGGVISCL